jgi:hypothetical protein
MGSEMSSFSARGSAVEHAKRVVGKRLACALAVSTLLWGLGAAEVDDIPWSTSEYSLALENPEYAYYGGGSCTDSTGTTTVLSSTADVCNGLSGEFSCTSPDVCHDTMKMNDGNPSTYFWFPADLASAPFYLYIVPRGFDLIFATPSGVYVCTFNRVFLQLTSDASTYGMASITVYAIGTGSALGTFTVAKTNTRQNFDFATQTDKGVYFTWTAPARVKIAEVGLALTTPASCVSGQYKNGAICETCPAGNYCPDPASKFICASGKYCPAGTTASRPCSAGKYCTNAASAETTCPAGQYCIAGVTAGTKCPAGQYCVAGVSAGAVCTVGQYCPAGSMHNKGESGDIPWATLEYSLALYDSTLFGGGSCTDSTGTTTVKSASYHICNQPTSLQLPCTLPNVCHDTMQMNDGDLSTYFWFPAG